LDEKVISLVNFMLFKYHMKEPVTEADMKVVIKEYEDHFTEIFLRACEHIEMVFGLDVKRVDPTNHCYGLFIKLGLTYDGVLDGEEGMPKTGILIFILGVIFMKGNSATEEEVWEVLNLTGIYAGQKHAIFGEPRELITKDFVKEKYLEYRQVANSDPAQFEFLWGPRAHAETTKMKVLEFLAKVHGTDPSSFPSSYEEALQDEEESARLHMAVLGFWKLSELNFQKLSELNFLSVEGNRATEEEICISQKEVQSNTIKEYEDHFTEIFLRACEHIEMVFGLDVKRVDPTNHCYGLFIKLGLTYDGVLDGEEGMPKTGILIFILGVIFMKGNSATEEEVWEVLNLTGIYAGQKHAIFGEPRELITKDFVKEKYLEYRQVANSDPAQFEFLWGPRAHAETTKMKVLEFLAKVHGTDPSSFPSSYEEALQDEEESARARISAWSTSTSGAT
uniref:MAGE domain-containing protein n=1 Tax=Mustela putorius furo TaxID=9669 RepID=M3XPC7_MUSPF